MCFKEVTEVVTVRDLCGGARTALLLLMDHLKAYDNVECSMFKPVVRF